MRSGPHLTAPPQSSLENASQVYIPIYSARSIYLSTVPCMCWVRVRVSSTKEMYAYRLSLGGGKRKPPPLVDRLEGGEGARTPGEGPEVRGRVGAGSLGRAEEGGPGVVDRTDRTAACAAEGAATGLRPDAVVVPGGTEMAGEGEGLAGAGVGLAGAGAGEEGEAAGGDPANISLGHELWTAESCKV